ncbi:uncharacterized protein LOC132305419 [Cornus florida]|uniref:uncharacterized protein LOC132305419 n=1 Tax=Cornus florida TaxID=4283 RepID=UPI0028A1C917|nr:uncharacterized protein LOC132305419 [Cornus florida]
MKHYNSHLPNLPWTHLVWSKNSIPQLSFTLWVAIQQKLPTLNRRCTTHVNATLCTLCNSQLQNHNHLFFECDYTEPLWTFLQARCGFHIKPSSWPYLINWASQHWRSNSGFYNSSTSKLALAALVYNIWMERNRRIFQRKYLSQNSLLHQTMDMIRLKFISTTLTDSPTVRRIIEEWDLPSSVIRPPAKLPDRK